MGRRLLTISEVQASLLPNAIFTVIKFEPTQKIFGSYRRRVLVKCKCGNEKILTLHTVLNQLSCGCYSTDKTYLRKYKIKSTDYPGIYMSWYKMKSRCYNTKDNSYMSYGAKGVCVCDEWVNDFSVFAEWALANGWKPGLQLDKDIKGNGYLYSPDSCLWVTGKENNDAPKKGMSGVHYFMWYGKMRSVTELAKLANLRRSCLYHRLVVNKTPIKVAMKLPSKRHKLNKKTKTPCKHSPPLDK